MTRRFFLGGAAAASAHGGQPAPPRNAAELAEDRVQKLTAGPKPAIALNHVGFRPKARKVLVYRLSGGDPPADFSLHSMNSYQGVRFTRPLTRAGGELGGCLVGDFSDFTREGFYQITAAGERSVPFFIRSGAWRRALTKAVGYFSLQRCGVEVPGVPPPARLSGPTAVCSAAHPVITKA